MDNSQVIEKSTSKFSNFPVFISQVYAWMAGGLLITFLVVLGLGNMLSNNADLANTIATVLPILFFLELGLVIAISAGAEKFSVGVSALLFGLYSISNGIFFGAVFSVYTAESLTLTFGATFLTFGVMALYGYITKQDLTKYGSIAIMGLFGVIIASIINLFLKSEGLYWVTTYIGIAVFIALIAYDTQKLKNIAEEAESRNIDVSKLAIRGALSLYLDFINLFILLLRIFGKRK
ncbi:MAG: Bax inhibitor-1/YccA family protein [Candidatus Dojkabacteria bacterium]|nr:Bax inhibitor-1/YccA family protein [Candidatus Dojkabacteria bacterium]MDQ7020877.1 Bax inhibitor-1/YccA family protein [Candidatus Dojkabacteria bacterium]